MDKTVSINAIDGYGLMIYLPPPGIYFEWKRSPILAQFRYVYEIGKGLWDNKSLQPSENKKVIIDPKSSGYKCYHPFGYSICGGFIYTF
jgi:hypothetical protein